MREHLGVYEGRHLKFVGLCGGGGNTGPARSRASGQIILPYDVGPARIFLGEAEKTPWLMCGLGPASRVKYYIDYIRKADRQLYARVVCSPKSRDHYS